MQSKRGDYHRDKDCCCAHDVETGCAGEYDTVGESHGYSIISLRTDKHFGGLGAHLGLLTLIVNTPNVFEVFPVPINHAPMASTQKPSNNHPDGSPLMKCGPRSSGVTEDGGGFRC